MTAAVPAQPTTAPGGPPVPRPRSRRWLRIFIPYAVVLFLITGTALAYQLEQPDVGNPAYLSPNSSADLGASRLAAEVRAKGVTIQRERTTSRALVEAMRGDTTLFVPAPKLVHPLYLRMIKLLPASTRVVIVGMSQGPLLTSLLPAVVAHTRLATGVTTPRCGYGPVAGVGAAEVVRYRYLADGPDVARCFGGSLLVVRRGPVEVTLVGADDPFRNDRIGERHNAQLATALLTGNRRLVWLDLHRRDAMPGYIDNPDLANQPAAPPSLAPASPGSDPDFEIPDGYELPKGGQDSVEPRSANPLWKAFPSWIFAAVALLAVAVFLLALALGRRLGGPVAEPLPIIVRATETVEGRGRLYQRARARGAALDTLRGTAVTRLTRLLDLPADAAPADLVRTAAQQAAWPEEVVGQVLYGPEPSDDRGLVQAALTIEALLAAVTHQAAPPTVPSEGELR